MVFGCKAMESTDPRQFSSPNERFGVFGTRWGFPWNFRPKRPLIGAGLSNLGNTCYLNAVVQPLIHTVPLFQILMSSDKLCACDDGDNEWKFCSICSLRELVDLCLRLRGEIVDPRGLTDNLSDISSSFVINQQEDAHEFLCCFLDRLDSSYKKPDNRDKEEGSFIKQIFGGGLQSQVQCCECGHRSDTFEPSLDLSLEIKDVGSLEDALRSFTHIEKIDDPETRFTCGGCKAQVSVEKRLSLNQLPQVLVLHLKRFKMEDFFYEKLDNHVSYPMELDLKPFLSTVQDGVESKYDLYAVVVHHGRTLYSGHYYSFIRSAPELWHEMDDETVTKVYPERVKEQQAYILFYIKQGSSPWFSSFLEKPTAETSPSSVLDGVGTYPSSSPEWENKGDDSPETKEEEVINKYTDEEMRKADSYLVQVEDDLSPPECEPCSSDSDQAIKAMETSCSRSPSPLGSPSPKERILDLHGDELLGDEKDYHIELKHKEVAKPIIRVAERGRMYEILNRHMRGMPRNKRETLLACMPHPQSSESSQNYMRKRKLDMH